MATGKLEPWSKQVCFGISLKNQSHGGKLLPSRSQRKADLHLHFSFETTLWHHCGRKKPETFASLETGDQPVLIISETAMCLGGHDCPPAPMVCVNSDNIFFVQSLFHACQCSNMGGSKATKRQNTFKMQPIYVGNLECRVNRGAVDGNGRASGCKEKTKEENFEAEQYQMNWASSLPKVLLSTVKMITWLLKATTFSVNRLVTSVNKQVVLTTLSAVLSLSSYASQPTDKVDNKNRTPTPGGEYKSWKSKPVSTEGQYISALLHSQWPFSLSSLINNRLTAKFAQPVLSQAQRRVEGRALTPPRADKTTTFHPDTSMFDFGKQQQMNINKMDVNMIPTAQERHGCRPTETKLN
ncbi:hypothetical protein FQN60_012765 [Etheostoma spectabile]|uniref:Uncharacterized protein n=1 Tax=Etheostoma spectabile TaxID=54343 RepID=A0A5J5D8X3_9PERO|nr:hypothetical protein FQN60_012765 [Etheostoma spectabile]